jgi:hypothetical protein
MSNMSSNVETTAITSGSEYNFNNIRYANPRTVSQGGKNVKVIDKLTGEWLQITTPIMLSFGIGDYVDKNTGVGNGRFELSQLFPNADYKSPETESFLENLKIFEAKIKADALTNSKEWFGKLHRNADVVDALWTPMLKYKKDPNTGDYDLSSPPSLRSKVHKYDDVWKCEIFDEDGDLLFPNKKIPNQSVIDLLPTGKKANVAAVLTCGGIWFTNGKFTVTWELNQVVMQKPRERMLGKGKCLISLKSSDKEKMRKQAEMDAEAAAIIEMESASVIENEVENQSDGEEEPNEESEEVDANIVLEEVKTEPEPILLKKKVPAKKLKM